MHKDSFEQKYFSRFVQELDVHSNGAGYVKPNGLEIAWRVIGLDSYYKDF